MPASDASSATTWLHPLGLMVYRTNIEWTETNKHNHWLVSMVCFPWYSHIHWSLNEFSTFPIYIYFPHSFPTKKPPQTSHVFVLHGMNPQGHLMSFQPGSLRPGNSSPARSASAQGSWTCAGPWHGMSLGLGYNHISICIHIYICIYTWL